MSQRKELDDEDDDDDDDDGSDEDHDVDTLLPRSMKKRNVGISSIHRRLYCRGRLIIEARRLETLERQNSIRHKHSHIKHVLPDVT
jgi:hypothetical protein